MANQLVTKSGEPRYTKIKGQSRYYDHVLGKSISHRQYWKIRGGQTAPAEKWTPEKAAALQTPKPAPVATSAGPATGSSLAAQLLNDAMLGSPQVSVPKAPSPIAKDIANELADDTKHTVESLAETVSVPLAAILILLAVFVLPQHMRWLCPEQEEAETMLEPGARLVLRNIGFTGKALGPNGNDMISLICAIAAYGIGAKQRLDDYLEAIEDDDDDNDEPAAVPVARRRADNTSVPAGPGGQQPAYQAAPDHDARPVSASYADVFGARQQQAQANSRGQNHTGSSEMGNGPATGRQLAEAASVRELFAADYQGRLRQGLN